MNTQHKYKTTRAEREPLNNLEQELKIRNFSRKTIQAYLYYNRKFLDYARKGPRDVANADIKRYLEHLVDNGVSSSTLNLAINALKFYYVGILKRRLFFDIKHAKKNKKLPVVLSKNEIKRMIEAMDNPKHKFLIQLLYATGLRVSEVIKVRMSDIDLDRKMVLVKQGKGGKDRYTILPDSLTETLKSQMKLKARDSYLFTSRDGKTHWHVMSAQKVVKQASQKARIRKNVSAHTLRHSFATHLLESGTSIRYIQELLGHKRLETTQIYTKVALGKLEEIESPLDDL
ncbi:tyrosine-type recombinase/integrase [Patescibacteria group bacterium]|nr:tyrosine-type recombinase/integrase [Patescibacteria group bacterium]